MTYNIGDKITTTDGEAVVKVITQDASGFTFGVVFLDEDGNEKVDTRYYGEKYTGDNPSPHAEPEVVEASSPEEDAAAQQAMEAQTEKDYANGKSHN